MQATTQEKKHGNVFVQLQVHRNSFQLGKRVKTVFRKHCFFDRICLTRNKRRKFTADTDPDREDILSRHHLEKVMDNVFEQTPDSLRIRVDIRTIVSSLLYKLMSNFNFTYLYILALSKRLINIIDCTVQSGHYTVHDEQGYLFKNTHSKNIYYSKKILMFFYTL